MTLKYLALPGFRKTERKFKLSNCCIITGTSNFCPTFGRVTELLLIANEIIFLVTHCRTEFYDNNLHAYAITCSANMSYISLSQLKSHSIHHVHKHSGTKYIYLKWYFSSLL